MRDSSTRSLVSHQIFLASVCIIYVVLLRSAETASLFSVVLVLRLLFAVSSSFRPI